MTSMIGSYLWLSFHDWELKLFLNLCHSFPLFLLEKEKENGKQRKQPHVNRCLQRDFHLAKEIKTLFLCA